MSSNSGSPNYLTLHDIINKDDLQTKDLFVPEWKGTIRLGTLSAGEMMDWVDANDKAKKSAGVRLIIRSLVDEDGERIGSDDMIAALKRRSAKVLNRIVDEILILNGLKKDETKEKDAAKNDSGEADTDASPTDSPEN